MKRLIYSLILVVICFSTFTSCIEEEVKPQTEIDNSGGKPIKE